MCVALAGSSRLPSFVELRSHHELLARELSDVLWEHKSTDSSTPHQHTTMAEIV
jgi:hypothetical protein